MRRRKLDYSSCLVCKSRRDSNVGDLQNDESDGMFRGVDIDTLSRLMYGIYTSHLVAIWLGHVLPTCLGNDFQASRLSPQ